MQRGFCRNCDAFTDHTCPPKPEDRLCEVCLKKDAEALQEALERIRLAEGADGLQESDPFQGDMFDAGEADLEHNC